MLIFNPPQLSELEKFVRDADRIFVDTCSFLHESAEQFFQNVTPILAREHKQTVLPLAVYEELRKLAKRVDDPAVNLRAHNVCKKIVPQLIKTNLLEIYSDPDDGNFADNVFLYVFQKIKLRYNVLFITQDGGLAHDARDIFKDSRAVKGVKKILVCKLVKSGLVQKFFVDDSNKIPQPDDLPKKFPQLVNLLEEISPDERFKLADKVVDITGNLPVTKIPVEGDCVTAIRDAQKRQIRLLAEVGKGGEGSVYKTDFDGIVAKIYKPEKVTRLRYEKLKLMLTKKIDCDGVCFPRALLYNQRNEFVGYTMKTASGRDLFNGVFVPALLKKYFPQWNRVDTVQLCVTILKKIKYLHDRNIILGDINQFNILVVSPTEVYFVDTDSYQVEGFICPVGTPVFTAPELQNKKYGLRTFGNENFAVATLLFMIMHPGKAPYAMQDGEGIIENIIGGEFSYPFGKLKTGKVPKGPWRFCWSHLTYKIKEAFYETFWRDGMYHDEKNRRDAGFWLALFEEYLRLLENGTMSAQDEESVLIFPTRFKKDRNKTYAKCKLCGAEFDETLLEQGICRYCLRDGEKYQCSRCGGEMIYTNRQRYIEKIPRPEICRKHFKRCRICRIEFDENQLEQGICRSCLRGNEKYQCAECGREMSFSIRQRYVEKIPRPKLCPKCLAKKNRLWQHRTCKNCGKIFDITYGQKEFFEQKGLNLPTRCENCRGKPNPHNSSIPKKSIMKLMRNNFR